MYISIDAYRASSSVPRILIFNQQSQRDGVALLESLFQSLRAENLSIQHAIFCTNKLRGPERPGRLDTLDFPPNSAHLSSRFRKSQR